MVTDSLSAAPWRSLSKSRRVLPVGVEVAVERCRRWSEANPGARAPETEGLGGSWIPGDRRRWSGGSRGPYVRFHRSIKSNAPGLHRNPKNRGTAQSFQPTLQVGHSPDLSSSHQHQQALALDLAPLLS